MGNCGGEKKKIPIIHPLSNGEVQTSYLTSQVNTTFLKNDMLYFRLNLF